MIGEIGSKHVEFLPEIVPVVINVLKDSTPAVARQAITCGIDLFRITFTKVAIQVNYKILHEFRCSSFNYCSCNVSGSML